MFDKINAWYRTHVVLILKSNPTDFRGKMNIVPYQYFIFLYQYLKRSVWGINLTKLTDFTCDYASCKKKNTIPDIFSDYDNFVIIMDSNVFYPPLDSYLDFFEFLKLSTMLLTQL